MATVPSPVVVCTYPARDHAAAFVALLRKEGIPVAVVPSDQLDGKWEVMVPGRDAPHAWRIVADLLARG